MAEIRISIIGGGKSNVSTIVIGEERVQSTTNVKGKISYKGDTNMINKLAVARSSDIIGVVFDGEYNLPGILESTKFGLIQSYPDNSECIIAKGQLTGRDPNNCNGHFGPVQDCIGYVDDKRLVKLLPLQGPGYWISLQDKVIIAHPDDTHWVDLELSLPFIFQDAKGAENCSITNMVQSGFGNKANGVLITATATINQPSIFFNVTGFQYHCVGKNFTCRFILTSTVNIEGLSYCCGSECKWAKMDGVLNFNYTISDNMAKIMDALYRDGSNWWAAGSRLIDIITDKIDHLIPAFSLTGLCILAILVLIILKKI